MIILLEGAIPCNCNCKYCYQQTIRKKLSYNYNLDAVLNTARRLHEQIPNDPIILHGGEPLTLPFKDIERILSYTYKLQGYAVITTNGTLINDSLIELFKRYRTSVTISIDGFYPLNELRCYPNNAEKCKKYTSTVLKNIELLRAENIAVELMLVIHRKNAVGDRLKLLEKFIIKMAKLGVTFGKINWVRTYNRNEDYALTPEEILYALKSIAKLTLFYPGVRYDPIPFFLENLWGMKPLNDCYFSMCDIFCTTRAKRILGDGRVANCSCSSPFYDTLQTEEPSYERYMALQKIPVSDGGCKGCKYWNVCFGGCPANAPDWRMRDRNCRLFYKLYSMFEESIRNFESIFNTHFELASDKPPVVIEDKPVHRIIHKIHHDNSTIPKKTTINGITVIERADTIEVIYDG